TTLTTNFEDANAIPAYARSTIAAATQRRLVVNYPNVRFLNPNRLASRAEVASFLCQALAGPQQASLVPSQYIAGGGSQAAQLTTGTSIPVKYAAAERIIVAPNETAPLTLTVARDLTNAQGAVVVPAGSQLVGQLRPANGGSQFVASQVVINGRTAPINASSDVITTTRNVRDRNFKSILGGAALGSGAAAGIAAISGDKSIGASEVLTGTGVGAAVGASKGRSITSVLRDAALGAAVGSGVSAVTGDKTITAEKALGGAAAGATIGGVVDRKVDEVVVIDPDADLTLTLNADLGVPQ
ncbi:MAG TPA: S-layer homology domain-containing protein, partial [Candidatus Caenarcaniphilales bacterium]